MRLKSKDLEIPKHDPFVNDLLNRKEYVENIITLFKKSEEPLVIALSGQFGIGKTTLLRMIIARAEVFNFKTIYFNAWKSDYIENAFSAILSEIISIFSSRSKVKKGLVNAGKKILQLGVPNIIKSITFNIVDLSEITTEVISTIKRGFASEELNRHIELKKCINNFKNELDNATAEYRKEGKQILIVIDELDRCKPIFAIKILESIKHLFDVSNIHFIFGLDYEQLSQSISYIYGPNTNVNGYLRRFFDLQFEIPRPEIKDYLNYLFELYDLNGIIELRKEYIGNEHDKEEFLATIYGLSRIYNASLRDLEKCFNIFALVLRITKESLYIFSAVLAFLIMLKLFDNNTYRKIVNYEMKIEDIIKYFSSKEEGEKFIYNKSDISGQILLAELSVCLCRPEFSEKTYHYFDSVLNDQNQEEAYKKFIRSVKMIAQNFRRGRTFRKVMEYLDKKINFMDRIIIE